MNRHSILVAVLLALVASCKAPPLPEATTAKAPISHREPAPTLPLGPNDVLALVVAGQPDLSLPDGYRVTSEGRLLLPLVGPVNVAGATVEEARARIEDAYAEFVRAPRVGLSLRERGAHRVHVLGRVGRPGDIVLDGPLTALEALSRAGGLRPGARRNAVALLRRVDEADVQVHRFSTEPPSPESFVQLLPGDVLFVSRSGAGVFQDEALPVLQGIGFTTSQVAAIAVVSDTW